MSGRVGAVSGYSAAYPAAQAGERAAPGSYYSQQAEAPGRWFGAGLDAVGQVQGREVEITRDEAGKPVDTGAYFEIFGHQVNPLGGQVMGRRPNRTEKGRRATSEADALAELVRANPGADAARIRQLQRDAALRTRTSAPFTDVTASWGKSVSIFGASLLVNAQMARDGAAAAREAGDEASAAECDRRAAFWDGREAAFQEILQEANRAAMEHADRWAVTRTGYHGGGPADRSGTWAKADIVATSWLQGTNRDGDPHRHVHNTVARMARTRGDGKWRALDTMALRRQLPAMSAIVAAHAEAGLTREFGIGWRQGTDKKTGAILGFEIDGISADMMAEFSARSERYVEQLDAELTRFREIYAREPNRRELLQLRASVKRETRNSKESEIDWDKSAREWDAKARGELAPVAERVAPLLRAGAGRAAGDAPAPELAPDAIARSARIALARVQAQAATWTRAELTAQVALALPAESRMMDPDALVSLVHEVTSRTIAGEFQQVVPLDAPEWPALPDHMIRELDGRSIYTRPGTERYATQVQLSREEALLADAQAQRAPHLTREDAARLLGAEAQALDAALLAEAQAAGASGARTGVGLRLDQAAAAFHILTSPRTAEVLVGPAGAGKTVTIGKTVSAWMATGRPVLGLAVSQGAVNELLRNGVPRAMTLASFLKNPPGQPRGQHGHAPLEAETLIVIDEGSMAGTPDLSDVTRIAAGGRHKLFVAGDHAQLAAVESGGGMDLLVDKLGHVRLAEVQRQAEEWERAASLRLRKNSDAAALAEYEDHGRIRGGAPAEMKDAARRAYVAQHLQGIDAELVVYTNELARELAEGVQDDLRHLGHLPPLQAGGAAAPTVRLASGSRAGAGDLLRIKDNDTDLGLANNEVVRIEAVNADRSLTIRRSGNRDPATGLRTWADGTIRYAGWRTALLGYTSTAHSKQGATVTVGLPVLTGTEDAHWLYSAMTRGAWSNVAFVFTTPDVPADPSPGTRAAPELAQRKRAEAERAGTPVPADNSQKRRPGQPEPRTALAVLADIAARDDGEVSATVLRERNMSDAGSLAVLHAIWQAETKGLDRERYRAAVDEALPPGADRASLDSGQARWLWRTMQSAETAGLDIREVAARAAGERPLEDARNVAAVMDGRIRRYVEGLLPAPPRSFASRVPQVGGDRQRYLTELAETMDERPAQLGDLAAEHEPAWATAALGPVPEDPLERLAWTSRASGIASYRETFGWSHETDPVGPEPSEASPEARAAWHAARAGITRTDEMDMTVHQDGTLLNMRAQYEAEYAWAPEYRAGELQAVRAAAIDQGAAAVLARAEAEAARREGLAARAELHSSRARGAEALAVWYRERAAEDEQLMADREAWDAMTAGTRDLARRADAEMRRRYPDAPLAPLKSGEAPEPEPELDMGDEALARVEAEREARRARMAEFRERLEARRGLEVPAEDPDYEPEGVAWPDAWPRAHPDAILQPPKPPLPVPSRVAEMAADREAEF